MTSAVIDAGSRFPERGRFVLSLVKNRDDIDPGYATEIRRGSREHRPAFGIKISRQQAAGSRQKRQFVFLPAACCLLPAVQYS